MSDSYQYVPVEHDPFADAERAFPSFRAAPPELQGYDPATGAPYPTNTAPDYSGINPSIGKLFGVGGNTRYQTWPERMLRSAVTLPQNALEGSVLTGPGLRREDFTDVPAATAPNQESTLMGRLLNVPPVAAQPLDPLIERSMDIAGLAGGAPLTAKAGTGTLGSGAMRAAESAAVDAKPAPIFYSAVENAVRNAKMDKATPEQWLGYVKNQPGVRQEELSWMGLDGIPPEWQGKTVTKGQFQDYLDQHKVELKEVNKNGPSEENNYNEAMDQAINEGTPEAQLYERTHDILDSVTKTGTKFSEYQLPGGENYGEKLLTLPSKEQRSFDLLSPTEKADLKSRYESEFGKGSLESERDLREYHDQYLAKDQGAKANYTSSHWDEPNVLAHVRHNDRMLPGPPGFMVQHTRSGNKSKFFSTQEEAEAFRSTLPNSGAQTKIIPADNPRKTLFLEEVQSDWHQAGRKGGYTLQQPEIIEGVQDFAPGDRDTFGKKGFILKGTDNWYPSREFAEEAINMGLGKTGVPDAPFKTTWPDLILKRMIRHAAENGYDQIAWTPGDVQAARYDLSKQISKLDMVEGDGGWGHNLQALDHQGRVIMDRSVINPEKELPGIIGKEAAERLMSDSAQKTPGLRRLEGLDLKVGGEGMRAFYDKMLPDKANALGKKFGAKVERATIPYDPEFADPTFPKGTAHQAHILPLTPQLKDAALRRGFPLFSAGVPFSFHPVDHDPFSFHPVDHDPFKDDK